MGFFLIYMKRTHPGQVDPELRVVEFKSKREMLEFAAENHVTHRGVKYYAAIEGGKLIFGGESGQGGLGDIYDELNRMAANELTRKVKKETINA